MDKRYGNLVYKYRSVSILVILFFTIFFTVGFASFSTEFDINNLAAVVRIRKDIRISSVVLDSTTNGGVSNWEGYNVNKIGGSITLPNSDSTVTYNVTVTNIGNAEANISAISNLSNNLEYTLNNYTLKDMLCDDTDPTLCKLGSTTTISITIGYKSGGYDSSSTTYAGNMEFTFAYMTDAVAKIGDTYYESLAEAIAAVPDTGVETTILLLKNTGEAVTVASTKNIRLDLNGKTLSNNGDTNIIVNTGTLNILNGSITSRAPSKGAIDNNGGTLIMDGITANVSGRQVLYNNAGTATIRGNCYLTSTSNTRATVQNLASSTMYILDGTIISTRFTGIVNSGTMLVGTDDGNINTSSPSVRGIDYGIDNAWDFEFYDGVFKGQTKGIKNDNKISGIGQGYDIATSAETIDGSTYYTAFVAITNTVTFHPEGGSVSENSRRVSNGGTIGVLPVPIRADYDFIGWFTSGDEEVTSSTVITTDLHVYAHWRKATGVVMIGDTPYDSIHEAIAAAPANTQTTIKFLKDIPENIVIDDTKNLILDLDGHTLRNANTDAVIDTSGIVSVMNGTLTSNSAKNSVINVRTGTISILDANIIATGARQAVYLYGGTIEISGNSYLKSSTNGSYNGLDRATISNAGGTVIVTGGTIESTLQHAIANAGTLTIGTKDGSISSSTPLLIGPTNGVKNNSGATFNFYDGIIKGKNKSINGNITEQETNSTIVNTTEVISNETYKVSYLQISE